MWMEFLRLFFFRLTRWINMKNFFAVFVLKFQGWIASPLFAVRVKKSPLFHIKCIIFDIGRSVLFSTSVGVGDIFKIVSFLAALRLPWANVLLIFSSHGRRTRKMTNHANFLSAQKWAENWKLFKFLINLSFFLFISVEERVVRVPQLEPVTIVVARPTCTRHVIPSALRAVFSWLDRISALARRSDVETSANCD